MPAGKNFCRRPGTAPAVPNVLTANSCRSDSSGDPQPRTHEGRTGCRRRPSSRLCRRVPQQRYACWHGSPPTDATPRAATCKPIAWTRRRLLRLSARGFALGLLRSLLRRGLRLRFGSLRHTALLAIRDGDLRNSAVANRHAPAPDYYSTMIKTATPLNESWMARAGAVAAPRTGRARAACIAPPRACARRTRTETSSTFKKPCGTAVSGTQCNSHQVCSNCCVPTREQVATTRRCPFRTIPRPQKNFA